MSDNESLTDPGRAHADAVISWIGWHTPELVGVLVPSVVAATVSPWFSGAAGLVALGWITHELRLAQRHRAVRASVSCPVERPSDTNAPDTGETLA
jgi:hypothetical protein